MPELHLFFTRDDERAFIRYVLEHRAWLVPDLDYESRQYEVIRSESTYNLYRKRSRQFFILAESYLQSPLEMRAIRKNRKQVYFLMQRNGGPTIDFLACVEFRKRSRAYISMGSLSHYPSFWDTTKLRNEKPPEALRELYAALAHWVKEHSLRVQTGVRTYWVGEQAAGAVRVGATLDGIPSFNLNTQL